MGYIRILAVIPGFFLSSLFVMLFSRAIAPRLGLAPVDYAFAMLITIALWIAVAPLSARTGWWWRRRGGNRSDFGPGSRWMMGGMMSRMMPMMMERWFSNMDPEDRRRMSSMCSCMDDREGDSTRDEAPDAHARSTSDGETDS